MKTFGDLDLDGNEIRNARFENLSDAPVEPCIGQLYFDISTSPGVLYWYDGQNWISAAPPDVVITISSGNHPPVRVATTGPVNRSGLQTIDGVPLSIGDRVLVKNQASGVQNGIYLVDTGVWTRASDAINAEPNTDILPGSLVTVSDGISNEDTIWIASTPSPISIGTTPLSFILVGSGPGVITNSAPADIISNGVSQSFARSDHLHGRESFGTPVSQTMTDTSSSGVSPSLARADHKHGMPGFGTPVSQTYGDSATAGSASTAARSDHKHGMPVHTAAMHQELIATTDLTDVSVSSVATGDTFIHNGTQFTNAPFDARVRTTRLDQMSVPTASVSFNGQKGSNVLDPSSPQDIATKSYVDARASGIDIHASVRAASTANLTLSAPQTVDGIAIVAGDRVLVKNQTTVSQNGIYLAAAGAWTRVADADASGEIIVGSATFVTSGTTNGGQQWVVSAVSPLPWVPATSTSTWTQNSSSPSFGASVVPETGYGQTSTAGSASTTSRSDHSHGSAPLTSSAPAVQAVGDTSAVGTGAFPARDDHRHAMPAFGAPGTPGTQYGLSAVTGTAGSVSHSDHHHGSPPLSSATPFDQNMGDTATAGTGIAPAREDHVHGMPDFGPVIVSYPGDSPVDGAALSVSRSDHNHGVILQGGSGSGSERASVAAATTANITLSGEQTIDGVAITAGDRVLVKSQTTPSLNGIYDASVSSWTRSEDAISTSPDSDLRPGTHVVVMNGTVNNATVWQLDTDSPVLIDTSNLVFVRVGGTLGTPGTSAFGDVISAGVSNQVARADHKHGRESFGASVAQTSYGLAASTGTSLSASHADHTHGTPVHDAAAHAELIPLNSLTDVAITTPVTGDTVLHNGTQFVNASFDTRVRTSRLDQMVVPSADLNVNSHKIINVLDPTVATDVANKSYVDAARAGILQKAPVRVASTANITTLSGLLVVDGVTTVAGDRVLVKDQTTQTQNGIYVVASGAWTRSTDADASGELAVGASVLILAGTQAGQQWVLNTSSATPWVPGSSTSTWVQASSSQSFGTPGSSAVGDTPATGAAATSARADHVHGREQFGVVVPNSVFGGGSANGTATTVSRSDHVHGVPALTANVASTQAVGDTATVGVGTSPARFDHVHGMPAFGPVVAIAAGDSPVNGSAGTVSHSDHNHGLPSTVGGGASLARTAVRIISFDDQALFDLANIDGVSLNEGDRVLLAGQIDPTQNGIYLVHDSATWTRATDADSLLPDMDFKQGSIVPVVEGDENANTIWALSTPGPIVIGTSALVFDRLGRSTGPVGISRVGDVSDDGSSVLVSRADHVHGRESFGPVSTQNVPGMSSSDGVATSSSRSDHVHGTAPLSSTLPSTEAIGDTSTAGSSTLAAHADHKHGMPSFGASASIAAVTDTQSSGVASTLSRSDHKHGMPGFGMASDQAVGDGAAQGVASTIARSDHKHGMPSFGNVSPSTVVGTSSNNGSATSISRSDHNHGTPAHTAAMHQELITLTDLADVNYVAPSTTGDVPVHNGTSFNLTNFDTRVRTSRLDQMSVPTTDMSMNSHKLTGVADPVNAGDAVNKLYADAARSGVQIKQAVRVSTNANLTLSAPGATIDGVTMVAGDRVLVRAQTTTSENGIYVWNGAAVAMTRATDSNTSGALVVGSSVFVQSGTVSGSQQWVMLSQGAVPWVPGSSTSTWTQNSTNPPYGSATDGTTYGVVRADGILAQVSRADHVHGTPSLSAVTPTSEAVGDTAVIGTATTAARADHRHAMPGFGTVVAETSYSQASSNGVATTLSRSDHTHGTPLISTVNPSNEDIGTIASIGTSNAAARADHTHRMPTFGSGSTNVAAGDHTHPTFINVVQAVVDFGMPDGGEDTTASVTVSAPWVLASTVLVVSPSGTSTPDHEPEDFGVEGISVYAMNVVPGQGFDLFASAPDGTWGQYSLNVVG